MHWPGLAGYSRDGADDPRRLVSSASRVTLHEVTLALTKIAETSTTITLGWIPPANVGGYLFYAHGQIASVATANLKDGTPRKDVKFSKTSPGPPFEVVAVSRDANGLYTLSSGIYGATVPPLPPNVSRSAPTAVVTT